MSRKWRIFFGILYAFAIGAFVYLSIRRESSGTSLTDGVFWLLFFSQVFAAATVFGIKNRDTQNQQELYRYCNKEDPEAVKASHEVSKAYKLFYRRVSLFVVSSCILLALCYLGLFALTRISSPSFIGKLLSTGIHIPFILYLTGKLIRFIEKKVFIQFDKMDRMKSQRIILCLSYYLDMILIIIDWRLGLFIAALIISREVCIDSSYRTSIKKLTTRRIKDITGSAGILNLTIQYCDVMVGIFLMGIVFFELVQYLYH